MHWRNRFRGGCKPALHSDSSGKSASAVTQGDVMILRKSTIIAAVLAAGLPAIAAEDHRELGPHEHGVGRLNIAIEGKRVSMELEAPGADIVGFEHEAGTAGQKAAMKKATATLENALSVFKLSAEAKCTLTEAKVAIHAEGEHDEAAERDEHDEPGDHDHHHSEFHAEYAIDCAAPDKLTGIDFKYFGLFAGARKLDVNLVTAKGQARYEVTREEPQLKFGEIG
jgi:hypothetical protein